MLAPSPTVVAVCGIADTALQAGQAMGKRIGLGSVMDFTFHWRMSVAPRAGESLTCVRLRQLPPFLHR